MPRALRDQSKILAEVRQHYPGLVKRSNYIGMTNENAVVQTVDESQMSAKFVIVTRQASPNLHNNKVQITPSKRGRGMILDIHKGAPNVLFEHGDSFLGNIPVGVSEKDGRHTVRRSAKLATAEVIFSQALPDAALIFALVSEGTMRMASIGFIPTLASTFEVSQAASDEGSVIESEEGSSIQQIWPPPMGLDFHESLLLEWSIVSTGADPGAFKQALSRGHIYGEKLTPQFGMVCQKLAGDPIISIPGWTPEEQGSLVDDDLSDDLDDDCPAVLQDAELPSENDRLHILQDMLAPYIDQEQDGDTLTDLAERTEGCTEAHLKLMCEFAVSDPEISNELILGTLVDLIDDLEDQSGLREIEIEEEEEVIEAPAAQPPVDYSRLGRLVSVGLNLSGNPPDEIPLVQPTEIAERLSTVVLQAFDSKVVEMTSTLTQKINHHLSSVTGEVVD